MSVYPPGTPVNLIARFVTIDPLTEVATPADPTTVTFTVVDPSGNTTVHTFAGGPPVTRPLTGTYICLVSPPLEPGDYEWEAVGAGAVVGTLAGKFTIAASAVTPTVGQEPTAGPCSPWVTGADVAACPDGAVTGLGSNTHILDEWATTASELLYTLSGRQFPGVCERKVRPCAERCGCFADAALGAGPWTWTMAAWGTGFGGWLGGWVNEGGDRCGCEPLSKIRLAGYPVQEILEVRIDGAVLDPSGYRLLNNMEVVRLDSVGPPVVQNRWPGCQNLTLPDTETGTFSITYRHGLEPPEIGKLAAAQLAANLYNACVGGACALPTNVTRLVRQGVEITRTPSFAKQLTEGSTGLQFVDAFLATANPHKLSRRPLVWSPDVQPYGREL